MIMPSGLLISSQRRGLFDTNRERVARALLVASGVATFVFLLTVLLWPRNEAAVIRVLLPKSRTLVIQEVIPQMPPPAEAQKLPENLTVQEFTQRPATEAEKLEASAPPPRRQAPLDPNAGTVGRARAQEATAALIGATSALDKSLGDLTGALQANATEPARGRRARGVRAGRSEDMLASVDPGAAGTSTALDGASVQGSQVAIGALEASHTDDAGSADAMTASATAPGTQRSNASLLSVVQKYAAGIQYCYSNELNRTPGLRGKLVVALTVAASGDVTEARILTDTMPSARLEACALSQIREWRFPPIAHGVTTFQAPFVFTPPK